MIYLDVTSSCVSVQNTGIQRVTRKIFAELSRRVAVTPICWNEIGGCYQKLGPNEHKLLTHPFDVESRPTTRPDISGQNPIAELKRLVTLSRFDFETTLTENDVFIAPDCHHDSRRKHLPEWIQKTGVRSVAIFHDASRVRLASVYRRGVRRYREYIQSLTAFGRVICISGQTHDDLMDLWGMFGCEPTSTCVESWPPALELNGYKPDSRADAFDLVVYVSSLDPRKNHFTLLAAAERLWREGVHFELRIIGRSTKLFGRKVIAEIQKLQRLGRPIRWLRHVDDKTLLRQYSDCRFTVYPSLMEGYGLPIMESLLHGKPCISGGNGALGEVASGGGCLIVDQTNEEALAAAIKTLLKDRQMYAQLCAQARAREFRSWADYIDKFMGYLQTTSPADAVCTAVSA
jgi:glycosyltransferase involved in cell wall biosynthesis